MKQFLLYFSVLCAVSFGFMIDVHAEQAGIANYNQPQSFPIQVEQDQIVVFHFAQAAEGHYVKYELYDGTHLIDYVVVKEAGQTAKYALRKGTYTLKVQAAYGSNEAPFYFTTSFLAETSYDFDTKRDVTKATTIPQNTLIKGLSNFSRYTFDAYKIVVPEDSYFEFKANKEMIASLIDATSGAQVMSTEDGKMTQNIRKGTYYLQMNNMDYEFTYSLSELNWTISNELEPNMTNETASKLVAGQKFSAILSANDVDLFTFAMPKTGFADFQSIAKGSGNANYKIYKESGELVTEFSPVTADFSVGLEAGNYYVELSNPSSTVMKYDIQYTVEPFAHPVIRTTQALTYKNPTLLPLNTVMKAKHQGTNGNGNRFKLTVSTPGYYHFDVRSGGSTITTIMNEEGFVTTMYSELDLSSIGLKNGTYYVSVSVIGQEPFTIEVTKQHVYAEQELNNTEETASPLAFGETMYGTLDHVFDDDYYQFKIDEPTVVSWNFHTDNNKKMHAYVLNKEAGISIDVSANGKDVLKKGTYYLLASNVADQTVSYSFKLEKNLPTAFKDVPKGHAYYYEIMKIREAGIITGYDDHTFKPGNRMLRHHVAAMIARANAPAIPEKLIDYSFKDVPKNHANYTNIQKLVSGGIIDRNPNGFNPNGTITRAQMAKILVLAFDLDHNPNKPSPRFKDVNYDTWYEPYVSTLSQYGITTGDNGYFKPNQPLTRQHFSVFLARLLEKQ